MGTDAVTGEKKRGKEAKYTLAAVHSAPAEISGTNKATGATETVSTVEYTVSNISEVLDVFGNDEEKLFAFLSDAITDYAQRSARTALSVKIQGPAKIIVRMTKDFMKGLGMSATEALDMVLETGVKRGTFSPKYVDANKTSLLAKLSDDEDSE